LRTAVPLVGVYCIEMSELDSKFVE
jgi:hypothetical protein